MLTISGSHVPELLSAGYAAFKEMLSSDSGRFGAAETPLGSIDRDRKRYLEFDAVDQDHVPPALRMLRDALCEVVEVNAALLEEALLPSGSPPLRGLMDRRRGPLLRLSAYPAGEMGEVNQPHTDIDLFTLLPAATQPGLELRRGDEWLTVAIEPSDILVIPGDLLRPFGGPAATEHRVVTGGIERISASMFVNADPSLDVGGGLKVRDVLADRLREVRRPEGDASDD